MFNGLNVLSGLIEKDVTRVQGFIDEFSQIYRYVFENVVSIDRAFAFRSFAGRQPATICRQESLSR